MSDLRHVDRKKTWKQTEFLDRSLFQKQLLISHDTGIVEYEGASGRNGFDR